MATPRRCDRFVEWGRSLMPPEARREPRVRDVLRRPPGETPARGLHDRLRAICRRLWNDGPRLYGRAS